MLHDPCCGNSSIDCSEQASTVSQSVKLCLQRRPSLVCLTEKFHCQGAHTMKSVVQYPIPAVIGRGMNNIETDYVTTGRWHNTEYLILSTPPVVQHQVCLFPVPPLSELPMNTTNTAQYAADTVNISCVLMSVNSDSEMIMTAVNTASTPMLTNGL